MHSSPRFSKNNCQHNERNSMLSTSSGGSSTLMDHVSQKHLRQKGYISVNQANRQQNFRKYWKYFFVEFLFLILDLHLL